MSEQSANRINKVENSTVNKDSNKWSGGLVVGFIFLIIIIPVIVLLLSYIIISVANYNKRQKRLKEIEEAKNYLFTEIK
jgi:flagellar basal body-associated protein FliL